MTKKVDLALSAHRSAAELTGLRATLKATLKELDIARARLGDRDALRAATPKPVVARKGRGRHARRQACAHTLWSDWHIEEHVDPAHVNGINEYTPAIAETRIGRLTDGVDWLSRDSRFDIDRLVIWLGGDLLSGYIHEELQEHNFMSPVEATLWLLDRIEGAIRKLWESDLYREILVNCNDGNHGRLTHKIRVATRTKNSIEFLLYHELARRLKDIPQIRFTVAQGEYLYHDVYDFTTCYFHGDSVKYQGGIGGLLIPMRRGLNELRKIRKTDIVNVGHFHQYMSLQDFTCNGSMIGMNEYALRIKCTPEPPQQAFYLLDAVHGKCQATPIWLNEGK